MDFLYAGSLTPEPLDEDERLSALEAEHVALRDIFSALENDPELVVNRRLTQDALASGSSVPDVHNDEVIAVWGAEPILRAACSVMMRAVMVMLSDDDLRMSSRNRSALLEASARDTPRVMRPGAFSPVMT